MELAEAVLAQLVVLQLLEQPIQAVAVMLVVITELLLLAVQVSL